ncbi:MAG: hypothetical protein WCI62_01275 [Erysipelotrichaceae bacterium]
MKFLRAVLGFFIAGVFVMAVWGKMADGTALIGAEGAKVGIGAFSIFGGWIAAFVIISPMWFMNHFLGMIPNTSEASFVDQGLGIALTGIFRDIFRSTAGVDTFLSSVPTIILVCIGAAIGGYLAFIVRKDMEAK